jgi:hypothetical protein
MSLCIVINDSSCKKDSYDHSSASEFSVLEPTELMQSKRLEGLHLTFNLEAGILLPLAIRYVITLDTVMYNSIYFKCVSTHVDSLSYMNYYLCQ